MRGLRRKPPWRWSRRQQLTLGPPLGMVLVGLAVILVLLLIPLIDDNDASKDPASPLVHPNPQALTPARVVRVIDGDTIQVDLRGRKETVRYYGVDAPERNQPCYGEAKARNQAVVGDEVRLLADDRDRDRFGRLLRYVFTPDGQSLDAALVVAGVGIAWRKDGAYRDAIVALEQSAREAGVGCLWEGLAEDEASP